MRIDRIQVDGFGRLSGLDTGPDPLEGLVVVQGPNEAGKSTLFGFLTTMLYGFQPATREANPHVPWGSNEAAGRVRIRLDQGGCAEVERRLRSQPSARVTLAGAERELRNQPLTWVEHVPRGVFRQVFAITLHELAGLDAETWARIQDKVVGSMGASDLRPPRAVADALEEEAGEIWRPNRRGNQRLRIVQSDIRSLRTDRAAAQERDARLRALLAERELVQARLEAARTERHRERAVIDRVQTLAPVKRQLDRVAALRREGGDRRLLDGITEDALDRLAALRRDHQAAVSRTEALSAELADVDATVAAFDDRARMLLSRRADVTRFVARATAAASERTRAGELDAKARALETRLDAAAVKLLDGSWREQEELLARLSIPVLRDRLTRAEAAPAEPVPEPALASWWVLAVIALVGVGILAWGVVSGRPLVSAAGAFPMAIAAVAAASWGRKNGKPAAAPRRSTVDTNALGGVRLVPTLRGPLTESLIAQIAQLQSLLLERAEHARAAGASRASVQETDREAAALGNELGLPADDADGLSVVLSYELERAERTRDAAEHAERERLRLRREKQTVDARTEALAADIAALEKAGARLLAHDPRKGLEVARGRLIAHRRADELQEELERSHPDLVDLEQQIRASGPETRVLDGLELARVRARADALEEETEQLVRKLEAMDGEAARLREQQTVDAVDSEIVTLKETEARLARERDRKLVIACILREADRRFREEHQPDLLRRASSYLAHLTGGRYDRLVVDEKDGAHLFGLVGPDLPAPVPLAAPVSTGTLEQAYLSLRLAIVDHLDQGGERLPLFVDEVFVNWDAERRARGLEVLTGIAATRQVFSFTCHPRIAEELTRAGGRLLKLERDE